MPRINKNGAEQNVDNLGDKVKDLLPSVVLTTNPVVICGVSRRVGLAHFEHIDIYAGIALPVEVEDLVDREAMQSAIAEAAEFGFNAVSSETYQRYKLLVDAQKKTTEEPAPQ